MELSVCAECFFPELPFEERMKPIRAAGFSAVEFYGWRNKDLGRLEKIVKENNLKIAGFSAALGEASPVNVANHSVAIEQLRESIETARRLGARGLILVPGPIVPGASDAQMFSAVAKFCRKAAETLLEAGVELWIEPLNTKVDHPGQWLSSTHQAAELCAAIDSPAVKILYDIYHQQIMEGDLVRTIERYSPLIGHYHLAGNPGRHEPFLGEINYPAVIEAIRRTGYQGFVGLEYFPTLPPTESLERSRSLLLGKAQ